MAAGIKLQCTLAGRYVNLEIASLWAKASRERVPVKEWPSWIDRQTARVMDADDLHDAEGGGGGGGGSRASPAHQQQLGSGSSLLRSPQQRHSGTIGGGVAPVLAVDANKARRVSMRRDVSQMH